MRGRRYLQYHTAARRQLIYTSPSADADEEKEPASAALRDSGASVFIQATGETLVPTRDWISKADVASRLIRVSMATQSTSTSTSAQQFRRRDRIFCPNRQLTIIQAYRSVCSQIFAVDVSLHLLWSTSRDSSASHWRNFRLRRATSGHAGQSRSIVRQYGVDVQLSERRVHGPCSFGQLVRSAAARRVDDVQRCVPSPSPWSAQSCTALLHTSQRRPARFSLRYLTYHDRSWLNASVIPRGYNKLYTTAFVFRPPASRPKDG